MSEVHVKQHTLTEGFTPTDEQMAQSDFGASDYASSFVLSFVLAVKLSVVHVLGKHCL